MPAQSDVEHLLRRTEFVARSGRVAELVAKPSLEAAVDDVLAVPGDPTACTFTSASNWERNEELANFWFNRMAWDSLRPIQEKMAFFWHGHFCSEFGKVGSAELMQQQIDTFRYGALENFHSLAITMSTQVAMLRYLDNNGNRRSSPNQNFARELMELFVVGVGNYIEADVEAATRAWTGHTDNWETGAYVWRDDWHDPGPKPYLGITINNGGDPRNHGYETINVMLGGGVVPAGAASVANRGRPTRDVAAEFISRKLWTFFAGTPAPPAVLEAMRSSAIANGFAIRPWLRTLLLRPEFYSTEVRQGLVRSPVDLMVTYMVATGLRAHDNVPLWTLQGMGQRPFFPPNVAGWKHNGYFVNASAMAQRSFAARYMMFRTMQGFWDGGDGLIRLAGGTISRAEIQNNYEGRPVEFVDRVLALMGLPQVPSATSRNALVAYAGQAKWWELPDVIGLALMMPEMNVA